MIGAKTWMDLYPNQEWGVNAVLIYHTPIGGGAAAVGLSGASVTINFDPNGYDKGIVSGGNAGYYGEFDWQHDFTLADQNSWGSISAAYCGKVSAVNSQAYAEGTVLVDFKMWWTGGWNPFAGTSGWVSATYNSGATYFVIYPNSVAT